MSVCARHFIIRNVIKMSEGLCAFYHVVVIIVCVHVCVFVLTKLKGPGMTF